MTKKIKKYSPSCPTCDKPIYPGDYCWVDDSCSSQCQPCCSQKCYDSWKSKQKE